MIKYLSTLIFSLFLLQGLAQDVSEKNFDRHELKLNLVNLIVFENVELNYEYIAGEDFTVGLAASYSWEEFSDFDFVFFPNARFYPSQAEAGTGFFTELSIPIFGFEDEECFFSPSSSSCTTENKVGVGVGVAAGYKLLSQKGFIGELFLGIGRSFDDFAPVSFIPRLGITFGKRF